ncbi:Fic family protein [Roseofilum casamattae]|uniref:Fic/DOC family N-terminal domain-containing protein n=1 Tax=Roseofilum casamattae BLCC-M143 TaxID=3022442 RepID=A0ABT7BZB0_9CYAN|nr:Fic/DOC family N-terminal domain-containing protein [Roseofilum casamattae]MDJ1184544.1 Fic/DOC family N-terminal domain-containing protein [Roseofilum casamattae BLCC-M143]
MNHPVRYHYGRFPTNHIEWSELIPFIGPAHAALAGYNAMLAAIPNATVLLTPLTTQEAVLSSRIEGTQATMGEVLEYEAKGGLDRLSTQQTDDINEVLNYRKAMMSAVELLNDLPLCQRVIKQAHTVLLERVRGHGRSPGEYRHIQNWIGPPGCSIDNARYIPISVDYLQKGLDKWEHFIHDDYPDKLVQLALIHAEFEALHPFLDGNGRLGRMCIPLFLYETGLIQSPMFYISAFFEANRDEYYERLLSISRNDDWTSWCAFFLRAVAEQAEENQTKARAMLNLYNELKSKVIDLTHSQYAIHVLDFIFARPIFKSSDFTNCKEVPTSTAKRILLLLRDNDILVTLRESSGRNPAIYAFSRLINIAEGRSIL